MKLNRQQSKIWELAVPYLKKGKKKNFIVHTQGVVKAMKMLLRKEKINPSIMIPAAILHDVGWSKVPVKIQKNWKNKKDKIKGERLHLEYSTPIIEKILEEMSFDGFDIYTVSRIVKAHKFRKPKNIMEELLIDADNLSDIFKEQFWSDVKKYGVSPREQYKFRLKNKFYTKTAQEIFDREIKKREKEIKILNS